MIIDYGDSENAAEFSLNDMVERGYTFILTLTTGESFKFVPSALVSGTLLGYKADDEFEALGKELEVDIETIEKVEC